jgi:glucosamine kinase
MKQSTSHASTLPFRVGVDGGGTGTRARLSDAKGRVLGEGRAGPSGLMQGTEQAWRHIQLAINSALDASGLVSPSRPASDEMTLGIGLAGANNPVWLAEFLSANPGYPHLAVDSDAFTALLGAHGGKPGALVIVGTGSIALAWLPDGTRRTTGGWGFPSGDEGSGSYLGLRAATLTQQATDGRRPHGALTEAVLAATGGSAASLLSWSGQAGQHEYATLAPLVFDTEGHDLLSAGLLTEAVWAIEHLIQALDPAAALPLAMWGSIGQRLTPRLGGATRARLVTPAGDALVGALALCSTTHHF